MFTQGGFFIINICIAFGALYHLILILYKKASFLGYKKAKANIKYIEANNEADVNLYGGEGRPRKQLKVGYSYVVGGYEYIGTKIGVLDTLFLMSNFETTICAVLKHAYQTNKEVDIWYKESSPWVSVYYNKTKVYTDKIVLLFITMVITALLGAGSLGWQENPAAIYVAILFIALYILLERFSAWKGAREIKLNRTKQEATLQFKDDQKLN